MTLAAKIYWFYRDNCCTIAPMSQLPNKLNDTSFVSEILSDLSKVVADCQRSIKQLGNPADLEGFDQILYNDHIELHNRAVDLYNDLMERGVDIVVA